MSKELSKNNGLPKLNSAGSDKRNLLIEQLEERVLFDAVPVMPVDLGFSPQTLDATAYVETANSIASDSNQSTIGNETRQVVFVDKSVDGYQDMVRDILSRQSADVFFINGSSNGFDQITRHLEEYENVDSIHIISHGNDGQLQLGNAKINGGDLASQYGVQLARIGASLSATGDILIYGCNLAASSTGETFIQEFSQLTNADVAASDDLTGSANLGGDWDLEKSVGLIEAKVFQSFWEGILANSIAVTDDGGNDDWNNPSRSDITQLGVDYSDVSNGWLYATIQMDETNDPNGNGIYAGLLFDTDGDGNANTIALLTIQQDEVVSSPTFGEYIITEFSFEEGASDSQQLKVSGKTTTTIPVTSTATLTIATNPFNGNDDSLVSLAIDLTEFGSSNVQLLNAVTLASHSPTSDPKDVGIDDLSPAIAVDDTTSVIEDNAVTVDVLANDNRLGYNTVEVGDGSNGLLQPSNGTVAVQPDGSIIYTPDPDFFGSDSFEYSALGLDGLVYSATVNVTVTPQADPPVANPDNVTTNEDTPVSGNILANDFDPDGDVLTVTSASVDLDGDGTPDALLLGTPTPLVDNIGNPIGTFLLSSDGSFTFTPATGFTGPVPQVAYTVSDGSNNSSSTVSITVDAANNDPYLVSNIADQSGFDSDAVSLDVSGNFDDPDGDPLTFTATGLPTGLTIDSSGNISGTIDSSASQGGPYTVVISADDGNGGTFSDTFVWTVTNLVPTAINDSNATTQSASVSGFVLSNDSDADNDTFAVDAVNGATGNVGSATTGSAGGLFTINSNGSYDFDPNGDFDYLSNNQTTTTSVNYMIRDADGGTDVATLTVTITGTNDLPTQVGSISAQVNNDSESISPLDASFYFDDIDSNDNFTYSAIGLPTGLTIDLSTGEITGTVASNASQGGPSSNGVYSVTVTADDSEGGTVDQTFTWTITNPAPTATNNEGSVTEDTDLTDSGNVITDNDGSGIDSDPDLDTMSVSAVDGNPANVGVTVNGSFGSIVINSNGNYTYTLDNNNPLVHALDVTETLTETFQYTVSDGEGGTASADLMITINGTNDAPIVGGTLPAQSGSDADSGISVDTALAFSDPDGDALTYSVSGLPAGLSIDLNTGEITGTIDNSASQGGPASDGIYDVTVTATDDNGASVSTTFSWTVGNPAPTATDNTASVTEDTQLTDSGNVITDNDGNGIDDDPDGDTLNVIAVDGNAANVGISTTGSYGSILLNSDGSYTYTLDNNNSSVSELDNSETLTETFGYTISDGEGGTVTATLTITINGTNDAPIVGGTLPAQSGFDADSGISVDTALAFSDPDGDTLTYSVSGLPAGLSIDLNTGEITGTIDNSASQGGPASDGIYDVTVTATDDNGASVSTTFSWTVGNPAPSAGDDSNSTTESGIATGDVMSNDFDVDGDTITVNEVDGNASLVDVAVLGSNGGLFTIHADGSYDFDTNNDFNYVAAGEFVTTEVSYTITDSEGGLDSAVLTISISGENDDPTVIGTIPDQTDMDDSVIALLDVSTFFDDVDNSDSLTFSATGLPTGLSIDPLTGQITGTSDNSASQGGPAANGVYSVTITADDNNGGTVDQTFTWTITNPGPIAGDDFGSTNENTSTSGDVLVNDSDPDNDTITVVSVDGLFGNVGAAISGSNGGLFTVNSDGSYDFSPGSDFDYLEFGESATTGVTYTINDGEGGIDTATLTITVNGVNDPPVVIATLPNQANFDSQTVAPVDVAVAFSDPDGETLTYSAANLPTGLSIDLNSGLITGTLDNSASQNAPGGVYTVTVTATDPGGGSVDTTFTWTVGNPAPVATDNTASVIEDTMLVDTGNVITEDDGFGADYDPDGDDLAMSAVAGLTTNVGVTLTGIYGTIEIQSDGSYTYTLDNNNGNVDALDNGETLSENFSYTVTDGEGGTSSATLTITINGTNDAPIVGGTILDQSGMDADTGISVNAATAFNDPDGDTLTYSVAGLPAGLTIDLNTGEISGTIDNSASQGGPASDGVYNITVTATDDNGANVSTTFTWTVGNPAPTATDNTASVIEDLHLTDSGNVIDENDGSGSDFDPDADALSVGAVNGSAANVGVAVNGTYGSIQISADGSYTYTLDNNHPDVSALDNGESLSETFTYTVDDGESGTSTATLTITINGTNDAPFVGGTIPAQSDNDAATGISLNTAFAFGDPDDNFLTYAASDLPPGLTIDTNSGEITGTIDNSASQGGPAGDGVYTVTITATDDNAEAASTTFSWTIVNPGPTASDNEGSVTEDAQLTDSGNVISDDDGYGVDNDPDNDTLVVSGVNGSSVGVSTNGSYGTIVINSDGSYTYTLDNTNTDVSALDNGESLSETFEYTVSDGEGGTDTAILTITVNGSNDAPIIGSAIPNQANLDFDTIAGFDVSASFGDPEGDILTYSAINLPTGLSIDLNTGVISGTIDNSASQNSPGGIYFVTVTATDDNGASVATTFNWAISNPGPTARDNSGGVISNTQLTDTGNVIDDDGGSGGDFDPDGDALQVNAVDGNVAAIGVSVTGDYGSIVINSDGSYIYTLDNSHPNVVALDNLETLTDTFSYSITDDEGGFSTAQLTITVNGSNDAPITGGTLPNQTDVDGQTITTLDASPFFSDPDGDTMTYGATGLPSGLSINSNTGEIAGTIGSSASQGGINGVYSVTVTATDDNGESVSLAFSWTVTNPAPTADDDSFSTNEDTAFTASVASNDYDPDNDLVTFNDLTAPSNGTLTFNNDGSFTYDPDTDFHGTDSFRYEIIDADGGTATATVTITIDPVNDAPIVDVAIPDQTNFDADSISFDISGNFSDVDDGSLMFAATGLPTGLTIDTAGNITGTINSSASQAGPFTVMITATDAAGQSVTDTFTWIVNNPAPTAGDDNYTTDEDTPISGNVTGNDNDIDDTVVFIQLTNPANGTLNFNPDGTFDYTPDPDFNGTDSFDYEIIDIDGASATATVTITIDAVNDPPVVDTNIPDQSAVDSEIISLSVAGNFSDTEGDVLTFSATGLPTGLSIDSSGLISGTIDSSASVDGPYTVVITASDTNGGTVTDTLTWIVTNPAPIAQDDVFITAEDSAFTATVASNDIDSDGDALTFSKTSDPASGSVVFNTNGAFTYTPDPDFYGTDSFTYQITDVDGLTSSATVTITIDPVNDDPVIDSNISNQSDVDSATISLDVSGNFADVDGDTLLFAASGLPIGLSIDSNGVISGNIDASASQGGPAGDGVYTVTIMVNDGMGSSVTETFEWTITNPNPNAVNDGFSTAEDTPISGNVGSNDTDPDGDSVSFNQLTNPANGTLVFSSDGSFTYTPDVNFAGIDNFDYEIIDSDGGTATGSVTISVGDVNDPPRVTSAIPDQSNSDSESVSFDLSGHFNDVEGDTLTFTATGLPAGLSIDASGIISGAIDHSASQGGPAADGVYTIVVTADDGNGGRVTDSFGWSITNPGPTATDDATSVTEDTNEIGVGNVITDDTGNGVDTDPDGDSISVSQVDNLASNVGISVAGTYGVITINSDGSYEYTLNSSHPDIAALDSGESLSESFEYTISDDEGGASTATLSITINGTNDAPESTSIPNQTSFDQDILSLNVTPFFSDVEGDLLTFSTTGLPAGLSINPTTGQISGTIDGSASQGGPAGDGIYTVTVIATDDQGLAASTTFNWSVDNPAPFAGVDSFTTNEDTSFSNTVASNDGDADNDILSYSLSSGPSYGALTFNPDGSFTYEPNANYHGPDSFEYELCDADGDCTSAVVSIDIVSVNDGPFVDLPILDQSDLDSDLISLDVSSNFSDVEGSLSFTATGLPTGLSIDNSGQIAGTIDSSASAGGPYTVVVTAEDSNGASITDTFTWTVTNPGPNTGNDNYSTDEDVSVVGSVADNDSDPDGDAVTFNQLTNPTDGTVTFNPDGTFTYTPNTGYNGIDSFVYEITDADGKTAAATVFISVGAVNDLPVVDRPIADQSNLDSDSISLDVSGPFSDPDGDTLTFTASGLPSGLTMDLAGLITGTIDENASQDGPFIVVITANDGNGGTATDTFTWFVDNPAPIAQDDAVTTDEDTPVNGSVIANDGDPDGDNVTYLLAGLPMNGQVVLDPNGTFTYTPDADFHGIDTFDYQICDADGACVNATVSIMVVAVNDAPVISSPVPEQNNLDSDSVVIDVTSHFSDVEGDLLTYAANGLPPGLSIDPVTGIISGTIDSSASTNGPYVVEIVTQDGNGGSVGQFFTWNVDNPAPVAGDDVYWTSEDTPGTGTFGTNDGDPDGDNVAFTLTSGPANGTVTLNSDGTFTYVPNTNFHGVDRFDYEITDADGAKSSATVTINVTPVNDAPDASNDLFSTDENTPITGFVGGNDYDPENDLLTYSLLTAPSVGTLTFNPDGKFSYLPDANFSGTTSFEYSVCDPDGQCDTAIVDIHVGAVNDPPIAVDDAQTTTENQTVIVVLLDNDSDPEGNPIQVTEINGVSILPGETMSLPSGARVTLNADGTVTYDPNGVYDGMTTGQSALDSFVYTIEDSNGGTAMAESVITINGDNDPPIAEDDFVRITVDTTVTVTVLGNDVDPENDDLAVVLLNQPDGGSATVNPDGTITFVPKTGFEGTVSIHYLVEDPSGGTSEATLTIEVEPEFAFDSFTNLSQTRNSDTADQFTVRRGLSQQIFTLAPEPIFSGYARPGTQIIGRIYDASGALVGEASSITDPGGNWMMQIPGARGNEFYRIEFEQVAAAGIDVYGYLGMNPADNSYQSMEPMTVYDQPLSVETAMQTSYEALLQAQRNATNSIGFGR